MSKVPFAAARVLLTAQLAFTGAVIAVADGGHSVRKEKFLYVWAGDQAHPSPDFLAVINFDEESANYGKVIKTVPIPPPGNIGNEPHHCHLNASGTILGWGGLLSLLRGQAGIFFFDVSQADNPRFLLSTKAVESSITDDFLPIREGGFLITQMGSSSGGAPRRRSTAPSPFVRAFRERIAFTPPGC